MPTSPRLLPPLVLLLAAAPLAAGPQTPAGKSTLRTVYVGVLDRRGQPVDDLAQTDFEVTEGAVKQPIVKAELAKAPMRIALMIDTSDAAAPAMNHIRAGLLELIDAVPPPHELLLVTSGRQVRVRVQPTADHKKVRDVASGLFPDGGATPLKDALLETDERFMRKADGRWPVFVIVTSDGTEGSAGATEKKFSEWVVALRARGVAAHAIAMKFRGGSLAEVFANAVADSAGGIYDVINTSNSLPGKMKAVADRLNADYERLSAKYEITFQSASRDAPVTIGVARAGVKIDTMQGRLR